MFLEFASNWRQRFEVIHSVTIGLTWMRDFTFIDSRLLSL